MIMGKVDPSVANLCRGKTRQGAPDLAAHSLGQVEAYLTVREILAEASTVADGVLWREFTGFGRFRFATLGLTNRPGLIDQHDRNIVFDLIEKFAVFAHEAVGDVVQMKLALALRTGQYVQQFFANSHYPLLSYK